MGIKKIAVSRFLALLLVTMFAFSLAPSAAVLAATQNNQSNGYGYNNGQPNNPGNGNGSGQSNPNNCTNTINKNDIKAYYVGDPFTAEFRYEGRLICEGVSQAVSLNSYSAEGPTWPTSGTQALIDHQTVVISRNKIMGTLTVKAPNCYYQTDLYWGSKKYDGVDGALPKYPNGVFGSDLIAARNGGKACTVPKQEVTPAGVTFIDLCGTKNDSYTISATTGVKYLVNGSETVAGTYVGRGKVVITAVSADENKYTVVGTASWSRDFTNEPCAIPPCVITTDGGEVTANNKRGFDFNQTRATGHYEFTDNGLRIYTESNSSTDKVAAYKPVDVALKNAGAPSFEYTSVSGIEPGYQLVVDLNNDGTADGILVGEKTYGNNWWLANGNAVAKAGAPHIGGGQGSDWYGTLDEWNTSFPNARVQAFGFSLGSGVKAEGVVKSITFNCIKYTFKADKPAPKDVCPNLEGVQTTVPSGFEQDKLGNCVVPGGRGGDEPTPVNPATPAESAPVVLGITNESKELADTGASANLPWLTMLLGLTVISLAVGATLATRPRN